MEAANHAMTDSELTLLSLVAEGPRYGYEIQQAIDERGLREWLTIGFASIYYILNKLERQNMLRSTIRTDGRAPAQKMYEITEAGQGVLQTAISDLLRQPRSLGSGFELGLANLHALKPGQVYKVLSHHRSDLQHRLDLIEKSWERHKAHNDPEAADHIRALYTHSIALMRAELNWLNDFISDWATRYPAVTRQPLEVRRVEAAGPSGRTTQLHRRTTPDAAKMIQRLRRPSADDPSSKKADRPPTEE